MINNKLSSAMARKLEEVSSVVLNANNPHQALNDLETQLAPSYQRPLTLLKSILDGKLPVLKNSLWSVVYLFTQQGKQTDNAYVEQYGLLDKAQSFLKPLVKQNHLAIAYFFILIYVFSVTQTIYRIKVLPVFESFFADNGANLPAMTQFVVSNKFNVFILLSIILAAIIGIVFPILFRQSLYQLKRLPWYLKFSPNYWLCAKSYHRYLWYLYSHAYFVAGDEHPITLAKNTLQLKKIDKNESVLLQTAKKQSCLIEQLEKRQNKQLTQLEEKTKLSEGITNIIIFLIFAVMFALPIVGMYLPIFMLGGTVG